MTDSFVHDPHPSSQRFSSNSEALLRNLQELFPLYYLHSDMLSVFKSSMLITVKVNIHFRDRCVFKLAYSHLFMTVLLLYIMTVTTMSNEETRFSSNSETKASKLLAILKKCFLDTTSIIMSSACSNPQPQNSVLPIEIGSIFVLSL